MQKEPSLTQPSLTEDPHRLVALRKRQWADKVRARNEARIASLQREIEDAEREAEEAERELLRLAEGGDPHPCLYPRGEADAAAEAARETARANYDQQPIDNGDIADLRRRLQGSAWEIEGQPKRRNGVLSARVTHRKRTVSRSQAMDRAMAKVPARIDRWRQQRRDGVVPFAEDYRAALPVSDRLKLPSELRGDVGDGEVIDADAQPP
ncbi:hypothetical protein LCM28_05660 [Salipiger pacificus]|nr:hypothetical protein [Alloyangia pacifica]